MSFDNEVNAALERRAQFENRGNMSMERSVLYENGVNTAAERGMKMSLVKFVNLPNGVVLPVGKIDIPTFKPDVNIDMPLEQAVKILIEKGQKVAAAEKKNLMADNGAGTLVKEPGKKRKRSWRKKNKAKNSAVAVAEIKDGNIGSEIGAQEETSSPKLVPPANAPVTKAKKRRNRKKSVLAGAARPAGAQGIKDIPLFVYCVDIKGSDWEQQCKVAEQVSAMGITFMDSDVGILENNGAKPENANIKAQ